MNEGAEVCGTCYYSLGGNQQSAFDAQGDGDSDDDEDNDDDDDLGEKLGSDGDDESDDSDEDDEDEQWP